MKNKDRKYKLNVSCSSKVLIGQLRYNWAHFAHQTSVHGMRHLVPEKWKNENFSTKISTARRILWIILILISLICFIATLQENLERFLAYPTHTNSYTETKNKIAFPFVIICPTTQFHTYTFTKIGWVSELYKDLMKMNLRAALPVRQYNNFTEIEADLLGLLKCFKNHLEAHNTTFKCYQNSNLDDADCFCEKSQLEVCYNRSNSSELYELIKEMDLIINKTLNCTTLDQLMFDLHYKVDRTIYYCSYKNKPYWNNCTRRFKPIYTYYGYCMIFNASDYFYENPNEEDKYVNEAGAEADLSIGLYLNTENLFGDQTIDNVGIGVKVGLIHPEVEDGHVISDTTVLAPAGFTSNLAMRPKRITFLPKANLRRSQEVCIEDDDLESIKLKYFKTYSPELCKLECLIERIYNKFKCKPDYAPINAPGEYCSFLLRPLLWRFTEDYERGRIYENTGKMNKTECRHCPLLCRQTLYEIEISSIVYPSLFYFQSLVETEVINFKNETFDKFSRNRLFLNIYFKNMMFEIQKEQREFTFISLLSSIGGFFGLFLGASILSIFEFFEFLILLIIPKRVHPIQ